MSNDISDFESQVTHRLIDFIYDHERTAQRWAFEDHDHGTPYDYVEFRYDEAGNMPFEFSAFPPLGYYNLDLHIHDKSRKPGEFLPHIFVALHRGKLDIEDGHSMLPEVTGAHCNGAQTTAYATGLLLDRLTVLENASVMIPAGKRSPKETPYLPS